MKNNFTKTLNFENLLIFLFIFFLIITNNYFGEFDVNSSARSSHYYLQIANSFPNVVEFNNSSQAYIHAERFLISYLIGFFSNLLNIKVFYIFCLFSYTLIALLFLINFKILNSLLVNCNDKIIFYALIIFNPYIYRYHLSNPAMLNDLIFYLGISVLFLSFITKKNSLFYLSMIFLIISRQTSLIVIIALLIHLLLPFKKDFIEYKKVTFSLLIFLVNYLIAQYYLNSADITVFYARTIFGLIQYIKTDVNYLVLIKFFLYPLLTFGPILILILVLIFKKNLTYNYDEKNIFFLILILGIFAQPIIAGPLISGKNIIRLSSFVYFISIFLICLNLDNLKTFSKKLKIVFISLIILWSMHPNFSKIKIFEPLTLFLD